MLKTIRGSKRQLASQNDVVLLVARVLMAALFIVAG